MLIIRKFLSLPGLMFLFIVILTISLLLNNLSNPTFEVRDLKFIGQAILPTDYSFQNTQLGGLSGITYDHAKRLYYSVSDDRSQKSPARFYTLKIDLSKGKLENNGVKPVSVTKLLDKNSKSFAPGSVDPEAIALANENTLFISSEGNAKKIIDPFIKKFALNSGKEINQLSIPDKFLPAQKSQTGIRNNLAFESLTITPDHKYLFTATENALIQDGSEAKPKVSSPCRILSYNLSTQEVDKEFIYPTEAVNPFFKISSRYSSGLTDLLALDNKGKFLSIERTFTGLGFYIALFEVSTESAENIHQVDSLLNSNRQNLKPIKKKMLLDLRKLDVTLDNIEGLTLGPKLPDGQQSLILVSDNNFNPLQRTQILAFKFKVDSPLMQFLRRFIPELSR
ncbi:esterase-like activity of phytase family protein [Mastigocoleus sp. MO_188.B34]|uniref:esterase-like activity of phytase family protein n=1 Tax=Mastigocoleus sp. MO_188.B34 TaxID=3036635 RepID=UPI00261B483C|nr:esterase-like activity of phytase family protein [Mastigocoleus sp. MO_188.B34]MDJ0693087.1 esterase-like activity of phytase family protein [Mastigocoleus sp. MO_188.B34]